ncbi:MAG: hypothetical protein H6Q03_648 [Acidobacteria bacterium]|jgi:ketosteroid isomerase-like protein|nr:hypothetical protein [Acidobacteriota bacterium]
MTKHPAPAPESAGPIDENRFAAWLEAYGRTWIEGDADGAARLFAADALYHETPFDEPLRGRDGIRRYWQEGAEQAQRDVRFHFRVEAVTGGLGLASWWARFERVPGGEQVELDGFLAAEFDEHGLCRNFREWWHRCETPPGGERARRDPAPPPRSVQA